MLTADSNTWIKICGTTSVEDALLAVETGADALGFIFAPSPRRISPRQAAKIVSALPQKVEKIGVFVNQTVELILATVDKVGLTGVQLHGDEDASFARRLKRGGMRILKTVSMQQASEGKSEVFGEKEEAAFSALLLDSGANGRGGTGHAFDWQTAAPMARFLRRRFKIVVAGGLTASNVQQALRMFEPWGVDVVSGVEREPGKKDPQKLRDFVRAVRESEKKA